jgi:hypothetical protein
MMPDGGGMLAAPMLPRGALVALAIGLSWLSPAPAAAVDAVPDEPGAIVLPDAAILQVVAADLDGDGEREVVRLVAGDGDALLAEVWRLGADGWALVDEPIQVLPESRDGPRVNPVYAGVPLHLLVHRVAGGERVVVASQPRFDEIDTGPSCCLVLHSLVLDGGELRRFAVAQPTDPVDGILVLDLDGDGTDELLTVRSLTPLGGISFPTEARVYRWADGAFGAPTVTELPIGSGDTPFIIGDSDGRPGDEAAFVSTLGPPGLYRIVLGPADSLSVDEFVALAIDAVGVPMADGRGIAVTTGDVVSVHRWPAFGPPGPAEASVLLEHAELIGVVEVAGDARLLVHQREIMRLRSRTLPTLARAPGGPLTYSAASRIGVNLTIRPYVGVLPGAGPGGRDAALFAGHLLPAEADARLGYLALTASLLGAEPIALVGDGEWVAILHSPYGTRMTSPSGGRFEAPAPRPDNWVSIVPAAHVFTPELDGGVLAPDVTGGVQLRVGDLATDAEGVVAEISAPPGSRVIAADGDSPNVEPVATVPSSGRLELRVVPPEGAETDSRHRARRIVITPAGHSYVARWNLRVLTEPPRVRAAATTRFGSSDVVVAGRASPDASVSVAGQAVTVSRSGEFSARVPLPPWPTDVEVVATDVIGNSSATVVSGIGIVDYRTLPWIPIVAVLVAVAGVGLYLRVPKRSEPIAVDDDAVLEEMEPE